MAGYAPQQRRTYIPLKGSRSRQLPRSTLALAGMPTPSAIALARAAQCAEETASRSRDARHHVEAETIKRQLAAELDRLADAMPRSRQSDKTWHWGKA